MAKKSRPPYPWKPLLQAAAIVCTMGVMLATLALAFCAVQSKISTNVQVPAMLGDAAMMSIMFLFICYVALGVGHYRAESRMAAELWHEESTGYAPLLRPAEAHADSLIRPADVTGRDSAAQLLRPDIAPVAVSAPPRLTKSPTNRPSPRLRDSSMTDVPWLDSRTHDSPKPV
jgi:hypothetical protein